MKSIALLCILSLTYAYVATGQDFDPATSPFADKPAESYATYKDENGQPATMLWGSAPYGDFGSRSVIFDDSDSRQLRQVPAPGVHPRIFFGPEDLPDVRSRLRETRAGKEAWNNILCWTEMMKGKYDDTKPYAKTDRWNGSFGGLRGPVPLFRLSVPREAGKHAYNNSEAAAGIYKSLEDGSAKEFPEFYWNAMALEAFRCLIEDDQQSAESAAKATVTMLKIGQKKRNEDPKQKGKTPTQPVGFFQLAYIYDLLHGYLTVEQKRVMHAELAESTWLHDNYGTFNTAESSRSNWATFSYWLIQVLAIEGEPGFNDLKVRGMYRGWRNLLTYGWYDSGATFEGEAKNQLGMDGVIAFATRQSKYGFENLCGHPYLQAYAKKFLPQSVNPMHTGFHKYDLLGGSRSSNAGAAPADIIGLKFMFPDDKAIDWIYRKAIGENYEGVPDRPDGYFNALLFAAIFASDFDETNDDPAKLGIDNTFFCGERALMMTRSSWDKDAMMLNMHTRQANGGHPFSDRNAIMVAGAGRIWSPNGYASFRTSENSVVTIDGKSQNENVPGRCLDFVDQPEATFMVGDAKYTWDWTWKRLDKNNGYYTREDAQEGKVDIPGGFEPVTHSVNDFAFKKLEHAYLDWPHFESGHWLKPDGAISPYVRQPLLPVRKAFRSAGLVRGERPYAVIVDDIQQDDEAHRYDWTLALENDIQISKIEEQADGTLDVFLTGGDPDQKNERPKEALASSLPTGSPIPDGQPMLWVKILNRNTDSPESAIPEIVELPNLANPSKYQRIRRLVVPATCVSPDFKVLLIPYRSGETLPNVSWDVSKSLATVRHGAIQDSIGFSASESGKTDVVIHRASGESKPEEIVRVDRFAVPLPDELIKKRLKEEAMTRAWVENELGAFKPEELPGVLGYWSFDDSSEIGLECPEAQSEDGKVGKALRFPGNPEGATIPVDLIELAPEGMTIAFWAKDPEAKGGYFFFNRDCRGISLGMERTALRVDADSQHRWAHPHLAFDEWQHVAWTSDGTTMRLYINGRESFSAESKNATGFAKETLLGRSFSGLLDELLVYRRALSADEIARIVAVQSYRDPSERK